MLNTKEEQMQNTPAFWDVIESRCSIRKFDSGPVPEDLIRKLLQAGTLAPNAHNRQSWRFAVLNKAEDICRMADEMGLDYRATLLESGMTADEVEQRVAVRKERICSAPLIIVIGVDVSELDGYTDANRDSGEYIMAVQSAALAGGYILLAAQALGLAGVWMCAPLFAPQRVQHALHLPQSWLPQGMLLLGYTSELPGSKQRKPLSEVVVRI